MKYNHIWGYSLTLIVMSIMVFSFHDYPYSNGQTISESKTQPGLFETAESSTETGRYCESPNQPGLFVKCEIPVKGDSNTEFCESKTQSGLFILCKTSNPKPISYCESETQPGLFVLCINTNKEMQNVNVTSLENRVVELENKVINITMELRTISENLNISSTNR